jgi:hypothetical protein
MTILRDVLPIPRRPVVPFVLALCVAAGLALTAAPAFAQGEGPGWQLFANTLPTNLVPAKAPGEPSGTIGIDVFNVGAGASTGTITVTDVLPPGVTATDAGQLAFPGYEFGLNPPLIHGVWNCTGNGEGPFPKVMGATVVTCTNDPVRLPTIQGGGGSPDLRGIGGQANPQPVIGIAVEAPHEAVELKNRVSISGGGALGPASTEDPVTISTALPKQQIAHADSWFSNADGTVDTQAGSHPYTATTVIALATALENGSNEAYPPGGEVRDLEVKVPPGFVGDLHKLAQCTKPELVRQACPPESIVGVLDAASYGSTSNTKPVFNMVPPPGVPAELAWEYADFQTLITFSVQTGGDYGIVAHVNNFPEAEVFQSILTLWGVPEEASHDRWRGIINGGCTQAEINGSAPYKGYSGVGGYNYCLEDPGAVVQPFLTLPTSCGEAQPFTLTELGTWQDPTATSEQRFLNHDADDAPAGFTGCGSLTFGSSISTATDTSKTDAPAGLTVEVKPTLGGLEVPGQLASADIQNTTVALPPGLVINPGQASGLTACGPTEDALTTEAERANGEENAGPASCANTSKVGTVTIQSPLIEADEEKQFEGDVYLLKSNPPELRLLVAASADGVNLKLVGDASLCETAGEELHGQHCAAPGQLITTFQGTPQLPFTVFKLSFSGGPQAALATPTRCGAYTTNADFTPWSSPLGEDALTNASFSLSEGAGGAPCPSGALPFAPTLTAGATTDHAGGFTGFTMLLQRGDGQQRIEKLQFKAPPGLSGMISSVPLCGEPQAAQGTCPASSHIGHVSVTSGPGAYPLLVPQPGEPEAGIFLTGPYEGAPFGLSIVTPIITGPFNLGTIVTRAKIEVDPNTAQVTITTDPLPQIIKGVPTDLRSVQAVIDRPGFMFNPTNCEAASFSGTAYGVAPPDVSEPGETAAISSRFQVGSCRELAFTPKFSVSTSGKTSRANGASLTAKLAYPTAAQGTQANIARVKVDLPKQLPSRLTTLQKACTAAQFETNPAGCPAASIIGHATVHTQLLPVPVMGPVYFVSHGGEAFPSLTIVLQGDNVTIDLVGTTFISKAGITSTTFKTVPDVPFNTFELTLPEGKYSALAANGNLCTSKLAMPTEFVAQNGAEIKQSTLISVAGCAKAKTLTRAQQLTKALKACHKQDGKNRSRQQQCEKAARKKFGPVKKKGRK